MSIRLCRKWVYDSKSLIYSCCHSREQIFYNQNFHLCRPRECGDLGPDNHHPAKVLGSDSRIPDCPSSGFPNYVVLANAGTSDPITSDNERLLGADPRIREDDKQRKNQNSEIDLEQPISKGNNTENSHVEQSVVLSAKGLTKNFGKHCAVNNISFQVNKGEIVVFLGPNGSGKTTTIRMITGYYPPSSGEITICDQNIHKNRAKALTCLGYLPEVPPLYPEMKVREFLTFAGGLKGIKDINKAVDNAVECCALNSRQNWYCYKLSKGYRQRVGVALSILGNPPLLIMDEPVSGLDPSQIHEMRKILKDYAKENGVFISSHLLAESQLIADRILLIRNGKLAGNYKNEEISKMGGNKLIIKTDMDQKAFMLIFKEFLPVKIATEANVNTYEFCAESNFAPDISRKIIDNKANLYSLEIKQVSLEDLYLRIMGETDEKN